MGEEMDSCLSREHYNEGKIKATSNSIWTRVTNSISYDNNRNVMCASTLVTERINYKFMCVFQVLSVMG